MLRGRFGDTSGRPFMAAHVSIASQKAFGEVSFLVDTGADTTVLMPVDADRLGLDLSRLSDVTESTGIGGVSTDFVEPAQLVFSDGGILHVYDVDLVIVRVRI